MELKELIEQCKRGDQQAQSFLYKRYSRQMLRICNRFVADEQVDQDLMHDGFIIIFTSISSLKQPEKVESWMGRIMKNLALRYINQTRSTPVIPLFDLPEEQEPLDEEAVLDLLPLETLLIMIESLPEGYRNVFKLSVLDGLSHKEIAELLHIAPHSSSSQFYRAKEYLKKMISQYRSQLLILTVLLFPIGHLLFWKDTKEEYSLQKIATVEESGGDIIDEEPVSSAPACKKNYVQQRIKAKAASLSSDTVTSHSEDAIVDIVETPSVVRKPKIRRLKR